MSEHVKCIYALHQGSLFDVFVEENFKEVGGNSQKHYLGLITMVWRNSKTIDNNILVHFSVIVRTIQCVYAAGKGKTKILEEITEKRMRFLFFDTFDILI